MDSSTVALSVIFVIVLISSIVGMYAGSRYKMDLEQWTVAGRGFGLIFVWLLMAGGFIQPSPFSEQAAGLILAVLPRCILWPT